jgi:hypothetical protein
MAAGSKTPSTAGADVSSVLGVQDDRNAGLPGLRFYFRDSCHCGRAEVRQSRKRLLSKYQQRILTLVFGLPAAWEKVCAESCLRTVYRMDFALATASPIRNATITPSALPNLGRTEKHALARAESLENSRILVPSRAFCLRILEFSHGSARDRL